MDKDLEIKLALANTYNVEKPKRVIFVLVVAPFMITFMTSALNLSVPAISTEFNISAALSSWVIMAYLLSASALPLPFGRIADLTNRKCFFIVGVCLFGASAFLTVISDTIEFVLLCRFVQGVGAALIFSTNIALLAEMFPVEQRGKLIGLTTTATYIGFSAGPVLGGVMNHWLGWRSIFVFVGLVALIILIISINAMPDKISSGKISISEINILGSILCILSITLILYGFNNINSDAIAKYCLAIGFIIVLIFIYHESKATAPIIEIELFKENPTYFIANLAVLLIYSATSAVSYILSIYLQVIRNIESDIAGLILISHAVTMALLSTYTGKLSDHGNPQRLSAFGTVITSIGLTIFLFLTGGISVWIVVAVFAFLGVGLAFFSSPNTVVIMSCVDKNNYSIASSLLSTLRTSGYAISIAIVTIMISFFLGTDTLEMVNTDVLLTALKGSFIVLTILSILAVSVLLCNRSRCIKTS